jgi:TonB-linked SusC/RagA family outer membrane protein
MRLCYSLLASIFLLLCQVTHAQESITTGQLKGDTDSSKLRNKHLSEVLVVGYGTQSKSTFTGSAAKISGRDIENIPVASFESALQGKIAGVVIESGSGKVGQAIRMRIRGTASVSAGSQPLYVIDGLPLITENFTDGANDPTSALSDINPNDIANVEILKDAAASAIYGARAANGVVLITTRKGKASEKTQVSLNISHSFSKPTKKRGFLSGQEYMDLLNERAVNDGKTAFKNGGFGYTSEQEGIDAMKGYLEWDLDRRGITWNPAAPQNTNWEDLMYRDVAHSSQVDLAVSGGNDKTRFYISGFYNDQEAILNVNRYRRYGTRINLEHQANERLSLGINLAVNRAQLDRVAADNSFSSAGQFVAQSPITPVYDTATKWFNTNTLYANGMIDQALNSNTQITFRTMGNVFASYKILPSLSFRTELGADIYSLTEEQYRAQRSADGAGIGRGYSGYINQSTVNTNNYFTYTPNLGGAHSLQTTIGMSYLQNDLRSNAISGERFPSDAIKTLSAASMITRGTSAIERYTFLSYFLRANYAYQGKYLATFSVRTDGSSRFGPDNRYGVFPAGSLGWLISEEDFLKDQQVLSFLKLRGSYGVTGNAEIGNDRFLTLMEITGYPNMSGYRPIQLGNPDLHWEKTTQSDIGLEFGFLNNRISGEIDVYNKATTGLLLKTNVSGASGYSYMYSNIGDLRNNGVEILLNSRNIERNGFRWATSLNLAYNKNQVKNIGGQIIESDYKEQRAVEGQPLGVFVMPEFAGVDKETGDALYYDKDGKTTNVYSLAANRVVGKSNPDWTGGLTNTFSYKGFDLNVLFTFVEGNQIYNRAGKYQTNFTGLDNQTKDVLRRWQKLGDETDIPRLTTIFNNGDVMSSRWLYDGSYIRLKSLSLGYTIPARTLAALHISSARVYAAGYNLWTRTKYISDPEVNTGVGVTNNIGGGIDLYTTPQARTITLGLNVVF